MKRKVFGMIIAAEMIAVSLAACQGASGTVATTFQTTQDSTSGDAASDTTQESVDVKMKSVEGLRIAFIPKLTGNAFFESANNGAQEYAKKWGFTVDYVGSPDAEVMEQIKMINSAVASGVDGICISSIDATGLDSTLMDAMRVGRTVVTWDSDVSDTARTLMVSQGTPDILGEMLVEMSVEALTKRGVDVESDEVKYVWHYSQPTVADQNSWYLEGEKYIAENYPNWKNAAPDNYYSNQDFELAVETGAAILKAHPDIDLIICNDSTALPGQAKALCDAGLTKEDITITGFASPKSMADYAKNDIIEEWGLWDCGIQGAIGCYLTAYLAAGNTVKVGDIISIPEIGEIEILPNESLVQGAETAEKNDGVVLLPERLIFTKYNVDNYRF